MEVNKAADKTNSLLPKKKTANIEFCCGWGTSKFGYERSSDDLLTEFVWSRTIRLRRIDPVLGRYAASGWPHLSAFSLLNPPPVRKSVSIQSK